MRYPDAVPIPILKRFHLVVLLGYAQDAGSVRLGSRRPLLKDAYQVFRSMDLPPSLDYNDTYLDILMEFKTQMLISQLATITTERAEMKALDRFGETLTIPGADHTEQEKRAIGKKWAHKINARKADVITQKIVRVSLNLDSKVAQCRKSIGIEVSI